MMSVTRRYHFSASHRLDSSELTPAENASLFGKCNNPFGHGHNYALEVTVSGDVDPETGCILPITKLDRLVEENILRAFAHRNLNIDVPEFARLVPTTENMALVVVETLQRNWPNYISENHARLARVYIKETERNSFEVWL
jgi:6-pyruvoyltetrahydropterin/6-carboxytetrahydropterin synthase